ncbi:MAG: peptidylprolyl isomerase [Alphaproteobacteria bacterium]
MIPVNKIPVILALSKSMLKQAALKTLFLIFALLFVPASLPAKVVEQVIAVVDGEPYTLTNLENYSKTKMGRAFPTGDLNKINPEDREVLEQFITDKLLESEIREAGIKVSDEDVEQYIEQIKAKNRLTDDDLKTALQREGQTLASYRASVKIELEKTEIINRQVRAKVSITNEDVERYYKLNASKYRGEERARIRHILLSLPENASPDAVQAAQAKAADLYTRIKAGEDFGKLANEYSEGAGRDEGGDIGWVKRGTLIAKLEEVAFVKLSVGQVSEPFRTSMGIHIVKLEARETGNILPLSAVASQIKDELYAKALNERFDKWLKTDLRRKHRVDVKLAGVVFKAEDSKEGMVDSLMARSNRPNRTPDRSLLSYLNPLSYITKETDLEEEDPKSPMYGKKVVSVLGIPLFTTDSPDDDVPVPDVPAAAPDEGKSDSSKSGGFFSSIVDTLNPFSSSKR